MASEIRESILHAIGGTPVVRLKRLRGSGSADVIVKLEYYNPTGSYKDRMALAMIEGAERNGLRNAIQPLGAMGFIDLHRGASARRRRPRRCPRGEHLSALFSKHEVDDRWSFNSREDGHGGRPLPRG